MLELSRREGSKTMNDIRMITTAYLSRVRVARRDAYASLRRHELGPRPSSSAGSEPLMQLCATPE